VTLRTDASATALRVTLRFFAAARAAVGRDTVEVDLPAGSTIADALAAVAGQLAAPSSPVADADAALSPAPAPAPAIAIAAASTSTSASTSIDTVAHAEAVFRRCSFLVDGVAVTDHSRVLSGNQTIDVMPPFAGG
jgi:molybdopterin synthase sulfur carrier subunit